MMKDEGWVLKCLEDASGNGWPWWATSAFHYVDACKQVTRPVVAWGLRSRTSCGRYAWMKGGVGGRVFRPAPVGVDVEMWAQGPPCTVHDRATHGLPQVPSH